jgi:archaemetzincin
MLLREPVGIARRRLIQLGAGALLAALVRPRLGQAATGPARFYLQPLGQALPADNVDLVRAGLTALIGVETRLLPRVDLPASAFYGPRRRYRAERLLDFLDGRLPPDGTRILGLTAADISTTKGRIQDWGVLGLGRLDGASSVISAFRCRMKSSGPPNARERLAKVAVHEAGHTLGLAHCPTAGCLMDDAEGHVATCDREYDFCGRCRALLAAAGRPLPPSPKIPWPRP